jgi:hypothetical protein
MNGGWNPQGFSPIRRRRNGCCVRHGHSLR